jgi:hypothetical protein
MVDFSSDNNDVTILPDGRTQKYQGEALGNIKGLVDLNFLRQKRGLAVL